MKYLKKFESNNHYYEEMSITEVREFISLIDNDDIKSFPATEEEKNILLQRKKTTQVRGDSLIKYSFDSSKMISSPKRSKFCEIELYDGDSYSISKLEDEWFIVIKHYQCRRRQTNKKLWSWYIDGFKCDQLEGLLEYLKSENLIT